MKKIISLILGLIFALSAVYASIERYSDTSDTRIVYRKNLNAPEESRYYDPFSLILVDVSSYNSENIATICTDRDKNYSELYVTISSGNLPKNFNGENFIEESKKFLMDMEPAGGFDTFGCSRMDI